jgi:superfamily II DNA or RNA helicase
VTLRPYQTDLIARVQAAYREGATAVCAQSATGSGKTHCAAQGIIAPSLERGRRTLFLADLEEIILDTTARLRALGLPAASILDGRADDPTAPVQVASQQTLTSWLRRGVELPPCDRVILDECHGSSAATTRALLAALRGRGAKLLGLTATPARGDGQALDEFDRLVCGPSMRDLIAVGALVPAEVYSPASYLERGIADDPVDVVLRAGGRAVIFAATAADAGTIARRLTDAGQVTEAVLDITPKATRRIMRARLLRGDVRHLVTVRALQKGFDAPLLDVVVLAAGGGTITGWLQSIGRGLRAHPGKTSARVYDLRGWVYLHGMPDADRAWSLEGRQGRAGDAALSLRRCKDCHAVFAPSPRCPRCGSAQVTDPRPQRIQRAEIYAQSTVPPAQRAERYLAATERAMVARGMAAHVAARVARTKAPAWVVEALHGAA